MAEEPPGERPAGTFMTDNEVNGTWHHSSILTPQKPGAHITFYDGFLLEKSTGVLLNLQLYLPVYRKYKGRKNMKKPMIGVFSLFNRKNI